MFVYNKNSISLQANTYIHGKAKYRNQAGAN